MSDHSRSSKTVRKYELRERARKQEETRRRITEAAISLHEERGPLATTIAAIAERAGVQRLTVYRHFPDEPELLAACTARYFEQHPPPDPATWDDPEPLDRTRHGLQQLYRYWAETEAMLASILRDYEVDPARTGSGTALFMAAARDAIVAGWRHSRNRRLRATVGHAVDFRTWRSLVRHQGLTTDDAVEVMVALVSAVAQ